MQDRRSGLPIFMQNLIRIYLVGSFIHLVQVEAEIFSKEPRSQEVPSGLLADIIFECRAGDELTEASYTWLKDGQTVIIEGRHALYSGDLYISTPQASDAGKYRCVIDSNQGRVVSNNAELVFQYLDQTNSLTDINLRVPQSTGVTMECGEMDYSPEYSVYFVWDNQDTFARIKPLGTPTHFISQRTGNMYLANPQPGDAGTFQCGAFSTWQVNNQKKQATANTVTLTIDPAIHNSAPTLMVRPQDVTYVKLNGRTFIECFASGNPTPVISWMKDGGDLPLSAATTDAGQLYFLDVAEKAEGMYTCYASNSEGTVSANGKLVLRYAPIWTEEISSDSYDLASTFTWTCAAKAVPVASYEWWKNGEKIVEDGDPSIRIVYTGEMASLTITDLKQSHAGIYQCIATNELGNVVSSANLQVNSYAPVIDPEVPSLTNTARGAMAVIPCNHTAAPAANITWSRTDPGEAVQILEESAKYFIESNGNLVINTVTTDDAGHYTCKLENILGNDESGGDLRVNDPTSITEKPSDVYTQIGLGAKLVCEETHDPSLLLEWMWFQDGKRVSDPLGSIYLLQGGVLEIKSATSKQSGLYECCAKTSVGTPCASAFVYVTAPPDAPTGVSIATTTDTTHGLRWEIPFDNHSPIQSYNVEYQNSYDVEWKAAVTVPSFIKTPRCEVINLLPYNDYTYRIVANNAIGKSDYSRNSAVENTLKGAPPKAPSKVGGGGGGKGDLVVTWEALSEEYYGSDFVNYVVAVEKIPEGGDGVHLPIFIPEFNTTSNETVVVAEGSKDGWTEKLITDEKRSNHTFKVDESEVYAPYNVKIRALNDIGKGPWSRIRVIHTFEIAPDKKAMNTRLASTPEAYNATLVWDELISENGRVAGYHVKVVPKAGSDTAKEMLFDTNSSKPIYKIGGLSSNTVYQVFVAGYNGAGQGPWSDPFTFNTSKKPPSIPPKQVSVSIKNQIISAKWEPIIYEEGVKLDEETLMGYRVEYWWSNRTSDTAEFKETTDTNIEIKVANNSRYNMWVRGYSAGGNGVPSSIFYLSTASTAEPGYIHCCGANTITFNGLIIVSVTLLWMFFLKLDL